MQEDTELEDPVTVFQVSHVDELPVTAQDIAQATSKDPILASVYNYIKVGQTSQWRKALNRFISIRTNCPQIKGVCYGGGE